MTTLLIIVGALILAVICRAILDPRPSSEPAATDDQAADDEATRIMEAIAMSAF